MVTHVNDKFSNIVYSDTKFRITVAVAIIIKRVWEVRCNVVFNQIPINLLRIINLAKHDLMMEMSQFMSFSTKTSEYQRKARFFHLNTISNLM